MLTSWSSIRNAERLAFMMLTCPFMEAAPNTSSSAAGVRSGADVAAEFPGFAELITDDNALYIENQFMTLPRLVTSPIVLKQELPLEKASSYIFNMAANSAPEAGSNNAGVFLNNVVLEKNNVAAIYGVRFRIGYGDLDTGLTRVYQTFGAIVGDNYIYNGQAQMQVESETQMSQFNMDDFKEVPQGSVESIQKYDGMMLTNPIRLISGQLGKLNMSFVPFNNNVSSLTLSSDAVIECSWFAVSGQASAGY